MKGASMEEISVIEMIARYNAIAKELLANKAFLGHILVGLTEEFADMNPDEAALHIDSPYINEKDTNIRDYRKTGINYNHYVCDEEQDTDITFTAIIPKTDSRIRVEIAIEADRASMDGNALIKRAAYCCANGICSQYGERFEIGDYEGMQKTYFILIYLDLSERAVGTIDRYSLTDSKGENMMNAVIVTVGNRSSEGYKGIVKLLGTLFSNSLSEEEKKEIFSKEYDIFVLKSIAEEIAIMSNLGICIEEFAERRGIRIGEYIGEYKARKEIGKALIGKLPEKEISEVTGLSPAEIKEIAEGTKPKKA